jgi:hypothetical protein
MSAEAWGKLFSAENILQLQARQFAASIQAHALFELGFEGHINRYEPRHLALVATQIVGPLRDKLFDAAIGMAGGDEKSLLMECKP